MAGVTGLHCLSDPWPPRDPCRHYSFLVCCIPSPVIGTLPIFGIGAGWLKEETEVMGGDFPHRWTQTREAILAMKELWTKDEAAYHGRYYNFPPVLSFQIGRASCRERV